MYNNLFRVSQDKEKDYCHFRTTKNNLFLKNWNYKNKLFLVPRLFRKWFLVNFTIHCLKIGFSNSVNFYVNVFTCIFQFIHAVTTKLC